MWRLVAAPSIKQTCSYESAVSIRRGLVDETACVILFRYKYIYIYIFFFYSQFFTASNYSLPLIE